MTTTYDDRSIMAEIAAASSEQATGLDEVGKAVSQMDEMTQQNAATFL